MSSVYQTGSMSRFRHDATAPVSECPCLNGFHCHDHQSNFTDCNATWDSWTVQDDDTFSIEERSVTSTSYAGEDYGWDHEPGNPENEGHDLLPVAEHDQPVNYRKLMPWEGAGNRMSESYRIPNYGTLSSAERIKMSEPASYSKWNSHEDDETYYDDEGSCCTDCDTCKYKNEKSYREDLETVKQEQNIIKSTITKILTTFFGPCFSYVGIEMH